MLASGHTTARNAPFGGFNRMGSYEFVAKASFTENDSVDH